MKKHFFALTLIGATALILTAGCGGGPSTEKGAEAAADKPQPADKHYTAMDLVQKDLTADGINATVLAPKDAYVIWSKDKSEAYIYGGKFFKITVNVADTVQTAENTYEVLKPIVMNTAVNPDFVKFVEDKETGWLKESKGGKLSFVILFPRKAGSYMVSDGMAYDYSPDHSSDYTADDIYTEYAAGRSFKGK
jgi:hypothetical protein